MGGGRDEDAERNTKTEQVKLEGYTQTIYTRHYKLSQLHSAERQPNERPYQVHLPYFPLRRCQAEGGTNLVDRSIGDALDVEL
jgi:hypothetical protein